jgi:hypothetical protein
MRSGSCETGPEGAVPPDPLQQLALAAAVICRPKRLKFLPIPEDLPLLFSSPHDSDNNEEDEDEEVSAALTSSNTPDTEVSSEVGPSQCRSRVLLEKLRRNFMSSLLLEGSLPCLQETTTGP